MKEQNGLPKLLALNGERKLSIQEQMEFTQFTVMQYIHGHQLAV